MHVINSATTTITESRACFLVDQATNSFNASNDYHDYSRFHNSHEPTLHSQPYSTTNLHSHESRVFSFYVFYVLASCCVGWLGPTVVKLHRSTPGVDSISRVGAELTAQTRQDQTAATLNLKRLSLFEEAVVSITSFAMFAVRDTSYLDPKCGVR